MRAGFNDMRRLLKIFPLISIISTSWQHLSAVDTNGLGLSRGNLGLNLFFNPASLVPDVQDFPDVPEYGFDSEAWENAWKDFHIDIDFLPLPFNISPPNTEETVPIPKPILEPKIMPESLFDYMNEIIVREKVDGNADFLKDKTKLWPVQLKLIEDRAIFDMDPVFHKIVQLITEEDYRCPVPDVILRTEEKPQWSELQQYFVEHADRIDEQIRRNAQVCTIM